MRPLAGFAGFAKDLRAALRAGLPAAALLAVAVGAVLVVGAHLSNSFPSADRPFGWPGPARFENGVAMVRPELALAASLPALLLGLRSLPSLPRDGAAHAGAGSIRPRPLAAIGPLAAIAAGALLVAGALLAATLAGVAGAAPSPPEAHLAFWTAHSLLAMSCFSIGFLARAATRRHAAVAGLGAWGGFAFVMDNAVRLRLFRSAGYGPLAAGTLPGWFYAAQALSPLAAYRATLVLWRPGFRDYVEHRALDGAAIPGWLHPGTMALVMLLLWVVLPLAAGCALLAWRSRSRRGALLPLATRPPGAAAPATAALVGLPSPSTIDVVASNEPRGRPPPHHRNSGIESRPRLDAGARSRDLRASFRRPPRPKRR